MSFKKKNTTEDQRSQLYKIKCEVQENLPKQRYLTKPESKGRSQYCSPLKFFVYKRQTLISNKTKQNVQIVCKIVCTKNVFKEHLKDHTFCRYFRYFSVDIQVKFRVSELLEFPNLVIFKKIYKTSSLRKYWKLPVKTEICLVDTSQNTVNINKNVNMTMNNIKSKNQIRCMT